MESNFISILLPLIAWMEEDVIKDYVRASQWGY